MLAMAALTMREGSLLSPLALLVFALPASRFVSRRLEHASQVWMLRLPLSIIVILLGMTRPFPDTSGLYDARMVCLAGELCAVEMIVQAWRQRPAASGQSGLLILLSGLILLAAADSTEDRTIWFFTPAYTLCLALALPGLRLQSPDRAISVYRRSAVAWIALALALVFGLVTHVAFRVNRDSITEWGMQVLHEAPVPQTGTGALSTDPMLGSSYGLSGSDVRAYRIAGPRDADLPPHLRVMAFDTYAHRNWLPAENGRMFPADAIRRLPPAHAPFWQVTRLLPNDGVLAAPLETSGFDPLEQSGLQWAPEMGPLKSDAPVPSAYRFTVGAEGAQGPFCAPPDDHERARLLAIPQELDTRVRDLARQAGGDATTPAERAAAVVAYLPAHHGYSLSYRPGPGDPVSRFLLGNSPAHCEYFASAAVLLLRCLGIPARYVIGYYAHERDPDGQIIVRQHDAHAWAEAWIDGKGWITLDATPGDGRPDRTSSVPWWTRINEWIADRAADARSNLGRFGASILLILAILVGMWIAWRNRPRRAVEGANRALIYSQADEELAALAAQFELSCRRSGLVFPPNQTWDEAIDALPPQAGAVTAFDPEAARGFVRAYNALRWGGADAQKMLRLKELLQVLEDRPRRR
jgi:hypothetical protein